jgi:peptide/nickel transport system permease protein
MEGSNFSLLIKKFSRYKVGVIFFWVLVLMYLIVILGGFVSPYTPGTPYQEEAQKGGEKKRELYNDYKKKVLHPPTPIHSEGSIFGGNFRLFTKEHRKLDRPGYNVFVELDVEKTLNSFMEFIKTQSVTSIVDNFPTNGGQDINNMIELANKLTEKNLPIFIKLVNGSPTQKDNLTTLLKNNIDEETRRKAVINILHKNFQFDNPDPDEPDFLRIIADIKDNYSERELRQIYNGDFSVENSEDVLEEVIEEKQTTVLDEILKLMGVSDTKTNVKKEQLINLFDDIISKIDDETADNIYVRTQTYQILPIYDSQREPIPDNIGFEGKLTKVKKLIEEYKKLKKEKKTENIEKHLKEYPDIIQEAIISYLGLQSADLTIGEYYSLIEDSDYYNTLSTEDQNAFKQFKREEGEYLDREEYEEVENKLYNEVKKNNPELLPEEFQQVIENSPRYLDTMVKGILMKTPDYTAEKILENIKQEVIGEELLNSKYEEVKGQLPDYIVDLIGKYEETDYTIKQLIRDVIPQREIDDLPRNEYTSVYSRDELIVKVFSPQLYSEMSQAPNVIDLFEKYTILEGKTVREIFNIIPLTSNNPNIPTLKEIAVNKYVEDNEIQPVLRESILDAVDTGNPVLMEYLTLYIKEERRHYQHNLGWFVEGEEYTLFWIFKTNIHLFGTKDQGAFYLLGADEQGRCILSRIIYGGRISLTVGFLGMFLSVVIAVTIGGVAGYFGGTIDWIIMRICEIVLLFPTLYLLLTLRGVLPTDLSPEQRFIMIVFILSFIHWAGLARVIRGFILAGKNQDYVIAAQVQGIPTPLIILKHLLPQISSYLIVRISIGIPGYIMMETNLSWLGFGISEPSVSWGLMLSVLRELSITSVANDYPWLLWPAVVVAITIMSFQLIGDAIRDTLDPMVKR